MTFELNLVQLITYPTHIHDNILDLILTNDEDLITNVSVNSPECSQISSDHFPISFSINQNCLPLHNTTTLQAYDYSKADFTSMNDFISNSNIADCLTCDDVESTWSTIKSVISEAMSLFIPKFQLQSNQYPKWFSRDIRHQLKCLHTLRRTHKRSPTPHNTAKLRLADEHFQQSVALAKSNYESSLINSYAESSNPAIYHYIRSYTKSGTIPPTVHLDDTTASSDASRASLFNRYFHSVFTAPTSSEQTIPSLHPDQINSLTFTEDEVYYVLCQLDPNKATGIDKISPKVLKNCAFSLTRPLCHLFNLSLSTGSIPEEWKIDHVAQISVSAHPYTSTSGSHPVPMSATTNLHPRLADSSAPSSNTSSHPAPTAVTTNSHPHGSSTSTPTSSCPTNQDFVLIGVSLPPIAKRLFERIEAGRFIEMAELLPENLSLFTTTDADQSTPRSNVMWLLT
ncbi:uncharacterized protein [Dysidea avara]|uniref:uncharacterized protein n=1 Tax=Dysidea avara TaxID=196820 RepID=UPI00331D9514